MHTQQPDNYPLNEVYLSLGSNLGNKTENIAAAMKLLNESAGTIILQSASYETAAWGNTDQPSFYNVALCLRTGLSPLALLDDILRIEKQIGRVRHEKWGPRLIDIDIIFYNKEFLALEDRLFVPHPEMQHRKFVLVPLAEIAPGFVHPVIGKTVSALLGELHDPLEVRRLATED